MGARQGAHGADLPASGPLTLRAGSGGTHRSAGRQAPRSRLRSPLEKPQRRLRIGAGWPGRSSQTTTWSACRTPQPSRSCRQPDSSPTGSRRTPPWPCRRHHARDGVVDRQVGADGGRHGLLDDIDTAGARTGGGILKRAAFDTGHLARHADDHCPGYRRRTPRDRVARRPLILRYAVGAASPGTLRSGGAVLHRQVKLAEPDSSWCLV